jgi:hypothetical protein
VDKVIKYNIAEYLLIGCIVSYTIGKNQPDFPAIVALVTMLLLLIGQKKFLGVLIGILLQFFALILFFAMVSEANELQSVNNHLIYLIIGASLLSMLLSAIGLVLIHKYGGKIFKALISD